MYYVSLRVICFAAAQRQVLTAFASFGFAVRNSLRSCHVLACRLVLFGYAVN